ncbi:MAG: hypothetical protein UU81_C0033G0002 [Microgenomates group bacterium GW2011_GWC1_41_8]|uniref:Uncharacterized protein n=2 Tax=Candidatus Roizmaniibacteriota TaxID=1752723 RepID=A0A0G0W8X0_9BACT|nr:MAG: hypothetical protein UT85_C0007G0027 [Candidatus Levybacteria bacterium GW2011_GWA2_40_16]KKR71662.1 MAG: hypothetical protein UU14_C0022G0010 [Candidatus Roizmanbacteria bacterium GW2011_GWB1_40_7]KKR93988.1 MAG: hypothetical protein UU41_C0015G0002 [Candidatus Roizmanbacteria bacterium GW2011_GWA1_41_13]KKS23293.1 MAG: hypothetical protein UU81_C0033G0002 [Microgenomates group bacterium GW2011_GWC1_41_8]OGK48457.1 MAG: hypothetical protein A3A55_00930 [Candidatus Roizmanbacteria bacte
MTESRDGKEPVMSSKIDVLYARLDAEGRVMHLTDEEILAIHTDIAAKMREHVLRLSAIEQEANSNEVILTPIYPE